MKPPGGSGRRYICRCESSHPKSPAGDPIKLVAATVINASDNIPIRKSTTEKRRDANGEKVGARDGTTARGAKVKLDFLRAPI